MRLVSVVFVLLACNGDVDGPKGDDADPVGDDDDTTVPVGDDDDDAVGDDDDDTTVPPEDCTGVTDVPTWTRIAPMAELVDEDLPWATVGAQIAGFAGVAYGNGRFVAVVQSVDQELLRWATSPDGVDWELHEAGPPDTGRTLGVSKIHFADGRFLFFGSWWGGGTWAYTSSDGLDFAAERVADQASVEEFASDGGTTLYVGANNAIASSTDLATWTPVTTTAGSFSYTDVAAGNGRFVATANGFVDAQTSADTASWQGLPELQMATIEFGRGQFYAFRYPEVWSSPDGVTFAPVTVFEEGGRSGWSPRFAGGRFVTLGIAAAGPMPLAASTDGATWTPFGEIPHGDVPAGATALVDYHRDVACSACTCVFVGLEQVQEREQDPWTQDHLPLVATARVLSAP